MLASVIQWLSHFHLTPLEASVAGTFSGAAIGFWTGRRAGRWRQEDKDELQRAQDELQKAYARLVQIVPDRGLTSDEVIELMIVNNGPEPIQQVGIVDIEPKPPGTTVRGNLQFESTALRPTVGMIPPAGKAEFFMQLLNAERRKVLWPIGPKRVTIEFMDMRGKLWRRTNYDEPEPITELTWTTDKVQLMPLPDPEPPPLSPDPGAVDPHTRPA